MPASNFAFSTDWTPKLQEVKHEIDDELIVEKWLVVHADNPTATGGKETAYSFMADSETREASLFFNFAMAKVVGDDCYLLASINGEAQSMFNLQVRKKENDKWVEDVEKTKDLFREWKSTGFLTAFHVNGCWNLELLTKVVAEQKVMLKDTVKCLFSKKEIPLDLKAKTQEGYTLLISNLKQGKQIKDFDQSVKDKLQPLRHIGLPSIVQKEVELEDDFGDRRVTPVHNGDIPDSVEVLFSPKAVEPYQKKDGKSYGMAPDQRMQFLFDNVNNEKLNKYVDQIVSEPHGLLKHSILCQITGLNVPLPIQQQTQAVYSTLTNDHVQKNGHNKIDTNNSVFSSVPVTSQEEIEQPSEPLSDISTVEEQFDWNDYIEKSNLNAKEKNKVNQCIDELKKHTYINLQLYVKGMEMDGSTTLTKARNNPEVIGFVCKSLTSLYKVLTSETLQKHLTQLPAYLLHNYKVEKIERLTFSQLKDLQLRLSELDDKASLEEVSLIVS